MCHVLCNAHTAKKRISLIILLERGILRWGMSLKEDALGRHRAFWQSIVAHCSGKGKHVERTLGWFWGRTSFDIRSSVCGQTTPLGAFQFPRRSRSDIPRWTHSFCRVELFDLRLAFLETTAPRAELWLHLWLETLLRLSKSTADQSTTEWAQSTQQWLLLTSKAQWTSTLRATSTRGILRRLPLANDWRRKLRQL